MVKVMEEITKIPQPGILFASPKKPMHNGFDELLKMDRADEMPVEMWPEQFGPS